MLNTIRTCLLVALLIAGAPFNHASGNAVADRYTELAQDIDQILARTDTPGVAVALMEPGREPWIYTSGFADLNARKPVTANAIFRTGSVAKILVSMSIMKLVEEGRLSLNDRVVELAPEVTFHNPWEATDPLLLVHLLNHSSGWDAPHFPELVGRAGSPIGIVDQLALHPHSRTSRWVPGTRTAYNNTGPLVAAHIVEKVSNQTFEEYVQANFFAPLGMVNSGYFYDDRYRRLAVTQYRQQGPVPYWHLGNRAAGGLHANVKDLLALAQFLQQPALESEPVLTPASVRAMERLQGTRAAAAGLEIGWSLGLTSFHHKGLVWAGHEGSLPGAGALLAYEPAGEHAHIVLANQDGPAVAQIHQRLQAFSAASHTEPVKEQVDHGAISEVDTVAFQPGYYRNISPVAKRVEILSGLMPWQLQLDNDMIKLSPIFGGPQRTLARNQRGQGIQPDSGLVVLVHQQNPLAGNVIHYGPMTFKPISALQAIGPPALVILWALVSVVGVLAAGGRSVLWVFGRRSTASRRYWGWPLATFAVGIVMLASAKIALSTAEPYVRAADLSLPGGLVFAGSLLFFAMAIWGMRVLYTGFGSQRSFARWHGAAWLVLNAAVAILLLNYGLIGLRLWA